MVRFLDMSARFAATPSSVKKDLYRPDELHLVKKGYEVWAETMRPLFEEMRK
jgi:lysophospholipase L1-like esterase